jgi:hypothetical protein
MAFFPLDPAMAGSSLAQRKKITFMNWTLTNSIKYSWMGNK